MPDHWLGLKFLSSPQAKNSRSGRKQALLISAPKSIIPLATDRNRAKRLIKDIIGKSHLQVTDSYKLLVCINKYPKSFNYKEFQAEIDYAISNLYIK